MAEWNEVEVGENPQVIPANEEIEVVYEDIQIEVIEVHPGVNNAPNTPEIDILNELVNNLDLYVCYINCILRLC